MSIKSIKERQAALRTEIENLGKEGILAEFREFFDKHPEVTGIAWTQYAPYFNDGDACTFSVHEVNYTTVNDPKEAFDNFRGYGEELPSDGFCVLPWSKERSVIENAVCNFWEEISNEEIFETVFGPDCKVLVTPLGIEVREHSHD